MIKMGVLVFRFDCRFSFDVLVVVLYVLALDYCFCVLL